MHLSREMRRFEMEDLSSRRGDRGRYALLWRCRGLIGELFRHVSLLAPVLIVTCGTASISSAQQIQVPYFLDDAIVVDAIINDKPARFLFDTGSSQTAIFKSGVDRMSLSTEAAGRIVIAGHEVERRVTDTIEIAIFGKKGDKKFPVLPFQHPFDAVLGWRDLPVPLIIDGRNRFVGQQHVLPPTGNWKSWKMEADNPQLFFLVTQGEQDFGRVFVDTGVSGGLRLSPTLWKRWKNDNKDHPTTLETFQYSVGEPMVSEIAWVKEYRLGDLCFLNLDIGQIPTAKDDTVVDANGRPYIATIGTRGLRHLRIIVSRKTAEVWTQTVSEIPSHNRLGAVFVPKENGEGGLFCRLLPHTPAAEAGLLEGDRLLELNDESFDEHRAEYLSKLASMFSQPSGTRLTIRVMRGELNLTVVATLRDTL